MKGLILVFALFVVVHGISEEVKQAVRNHGKVCASENGVTKEELDKLRAGDWSNDADDIKKFSACMLKKTIVDKDGVYQKELSISKVEESEKEKVREVLDKCEKLVGTVNTETAYEFAKCYHSEYPGHAIF